MKGSTQVGRLGRLYYLRYLTPASRVLLLLFMTICICLGACGDDDGPTKPQGPSVTLLYPNGGEILQAGDIVQVSWSASDPDTPVEALSYSLELSTDAGSVWIPLVSNAPSNQGFFDWTAPSISTNEGRIRVTVSDGDRTAQDMSDGNFTIAYTPPPILRNYLSLEDGEGDTGQEVTVGLLLDNDDPISSLETEIVYDPAVISWVSGARSARAGDMSFQAQVLQAGRVKITMIHAAPAVLESDDGAIATLTFELVGQMDASSDLEPDNSTLLDDEGDPVNVIERSGTILVVGPPVNNPPVVTLKSPVGGEYWEAGSVRTVTWTATDDETPQQELVVSLHYSSDSGGSWSLIAAEEVNDGAYDWTVPNAPTTRARVRVTASDGVNETSASSPADFSITTPPAGENALSIGTGSGDSGSEVTVPLGLDNDDAVKGLQADITFDPAVLEYVGGSVTGRVGTMSYAASVVGGNTLRVIMYYADASSISSGTGAIANITFRLIGAGGAQSALTFASATLSDLDAQPLPVTTQNGSVSVTGGGGSDNTLSIGTGSGDSGSEVTVPLGLDNDDAVKGLQADITFDPAVLEYVGGSVTGRVGTMSYAASVVGGNTLRVIMYYADASSISSGTGAIANIIFRLIGAGGTQSALAFASATLSDLDAQPLPVTHEDGSIAVLSKGDD